MSASPLQADAPPPPTRAEAGAGLQPTSAGRPRPPGALPRSLSARRAGPADANEGQPPPLDHGPPARRPGEHLLAAAADRIRFLPNARRLARRRIAITLTKWLLPLCAVTLLGAVALWPEIDRASDQARLSFRRVSAGVDGARMVEPQYHGVDEKGRPYTLTAATARQIAPERIDLTQPKGDMTLENGTWLMINAKLGTFMQKANQLDLSQDVTLYRDDGTTMTTNSTSIDLKNGAAAGSEPVHAEGPFGVLDAQGFTVVDKGAAIQFIGPAHLVLNGASP